MNDLYGFCFRHYEKYFAVNNYDTCTNVNTMESCYLEPSGDQQKDSQ